MASTSQRHRTERLSWQGGPLPRLRSLCVRPPRWFRLRDLSWRRALRRLPLYAGLAMAVGALALVLAGSVPRLFGYDTFIVYGGSMVPALRPGDVALTRPIAPEDVRVGDIIATRSSAESTPVLHRVTAIEEVDGQRQFIIKGDSNESADPEPVLLLGSGQRVVQRVPLAGYLIHFLGTPAGRLLFLVLPAVLLGGIVLWEIWRPRRRAETLNPALAPDGPRTEASSAPDFVPTPEKATLGRRRARAKAPSGASSRALSVVAASRVPKGGTKPRASPNSARKGRLTSRVTAAKKHDGKRRAAA